MKNTILTSLVSILLLSCSTSTVKEKINKAGDVAGQTAGEFIEGASKGLQKAFDVQVAPTASFTAKGLALGKTTVTSDAKATDNVLVVYLIFNQDYSGKLTAKIFDDKQAEMGRSTILVTGKKDDAKYVEFHFDKRANMDSKHRITIE
jgi:hypothetical protein